MCGVYAPKGRTRLLISDGVPALHVDMAWFLSCSLMLALMRSRSAVLGVGEGPVVTLALAHDPHDPGGGAPADAVQRGRMVDAFWHALGSARRGCAVRASRDQKPLCWSSAANAASLHRCHRFCRMP